MESPRLSLGIDLSTQSISAIVIDIGKIEAVAEISLNYLKDERLNCFGIREDIFEDAGLLITACYQQFLDFHWGYDYPKL